MKTSTAPGGTPKPEDPRARSGKWLCIVVMTVIAGGLLLLAGSIASQTGMGAVEQARRGDWEQAAAYAFYGLLFAGFPVCFVWLAAGDIRQSQKDAAVKLAHSDEPWFWRSDWHTLQISNRLDKLEVVGLVWMVLLALPFAGMIFLEGMRWPSQSGWERFGAVGWFVLHLLIFYALGQSVLLPALRRLRFGASTLLLHYPGGPDLQRLEATVRVPAPGSGRMEFRVTLRAFERTEQPGAEGPIFVEKEASIRSLTHSCHGSISSLEIPIAFDLPADCGSTTSFQTNTVGRVWKLEVQAERPWFDYRAEFEVPVFRRAKVDDADSLKHS